MSDKIREALEGMLAIHDEPAGFQGKYGRALDEAIAAQKVKIDQRIAAARAALAQQPAPAAPVAVGQEPVQMHHEPHNRAMWHTNCPGRRFASPMKPRGDGSWECVVCRAEGRVTAPPAPPAAEQPDTVTELRDLMRRYFGALDRFDQEGPVSIVVAAAKEAETLEKELRALLAGGEA